MQGWGVLLLFLSLIHFYNFGKASQSKDEKVRATAWMWIAAGVFTIVAGLGVMRH
jgi:hypothetical protein